MTPHHQNLPQPRAQLMAFTNEEGDSWCSIQLHNDPTDNMVGVARPSLRGPRFAGLVTTHSILRFWQSTHQKPKYSPALLTYNCTTLCAICKLSRHFYPQIRLTHSTNTLFTHTHTHTTLDWVGHHPHYHLSSVYRVVSHVIVYISWLVEHLPTPTRIATTSFLSNLFQPLNSHKKLLLPIRHPGQTVDPTFG